MNADWHTARDISLDDKAWPSCEYPAYRTAVKNCLDCGIFDTAAFVRGQPAEQYKKGLEARRAILYKEIVYHLETLVKGTGWFDRLAFMEPMNPMGTQAREETARSLLASREQENPVSDR